MKVKARFYESVIYWRARPFEYFLARITRFKKVVYLPFIKTYFINDPLVAKQVLKDIENFSSAHTGSLGELVSSVMGSDSKALFNMNGAEHEELKFKLLNIFQPQYIDGMVEQALGRELQWLKKEIRAGRAIDLAAFTKRCSARTTCHMLGIVHDDKAYEDMLLKVTQLSDDITSMVSVSSNALSRKKQQKGQAAYAEFSKIIRKYYDMDNQHSSSIIYELKRRNFSFEDAKALLVVLIMAGTETVSSGLPRIIALLIDDEHWAELHSNPEKVQAALTEGLRFTSPGAAILHSTIKDSSVEGFTFKKDRRIIIVLLNILRSNKYYPRAYTLDFERQQNDQYKNFWFGAGPHFCLGSELAKKEIRAVLQTLITASKAPEIRKRTFTRGSSFPGYKSLVVDFPTLHASST